MKDPKMKLPMIMSKWSKIIADDKRFCENFARQMLYENKEVALQSIY